MYIKSILLLKVLRTIGIINNITLLSNIYYFVAASLILNCYFHSLFFGIKSRRKTFKGSFACFFDLDAFFSLILKTFFRSSMSY